jgi:2-keto-4-pentenoate hydratase/2-oxohepta-3-ene-1,7-dioic acid hydratase in catechol pathway
MIKKERWIDVRLLLILRGGSSIRFVRFTEKQSSHIYSGVLEDRVIKVIEGDPLTAWKFTKNEYILDDVMLLSPIVPRNIIGIGKNYLASDEKRPQKLPDIPVLFYKPSTTVIGTEGNIILPPTVKEVKFESELAVVIGKQAKGISPEEVVDHIFGYTVANDVTAPALFHPDGH